MKGRERSVTISCPPLPPVGEQVRPEQERTRDVEHQRAGRRAPGSRHHGGRPLPFHVHRHHPHRHEAAEAHVGLGLRSVSPPRSMYLLSVSEQTDMTFYRLQWG